MKGAVQTYNMVYPWNDLPAGLALHGGCPLVLVAIIDMRKVGATAVSWVGWGISSDAAEAGGEEVECERCWMGQEDKGGMDERMRVWWAWWH